MSRLLQLRQQAHCVRTLSHARHKQNCQFSTSPVNTVLSGIQPTGNIHLGNYLGAITYWVSLQATVGKKLYTIVDLHAITVPQESSILSGNILDMACALLACGIDPARSSLFIQSEVKEHTELMWVLSCVAPHSLLNTMTQYKDKTQGKAQDTVPLGLFSYPVLMASDILSYRATQVPVGADQTQHLEFTCKLARLFNKRFQMDFFPEPRPIFDAHVGVRRVMNLRDPSSKMSKSDRSVNSVLSLTDTADEIATKVAKAETDSENGITYDAKNRPGLANLLNIYSSLQQAPMQQVTDLFGSGNKANFKKSLVDLLVSKLCPIGTRLQELKRDKAHVRKLLDKGRDEAREIASKTLEDVNRLVGLGMRL